MQPTLCARCHKNMAVVFINRIENGQSHQEGLCLSCARELHIKPIDDMIAKMGISDEELENLTNEMMDAMRSLPGNGEGLMEIENDEETDDDGKTATFPFLNRLFGTQNNNSMPENRPEGGANSSPRPKENADRKSKHKFLDSCAFMSPAAAVPTRGFTRCATVPISAAAAPFRSIVFRLRSTPGCRAISRSAMPVRWTKASMPSDPA